MLVYNSPPEAIGGPKILQKIELLLADNYRVIRIQHYPVTNSILLLPAG